MIFHEYYPLTKSIQYQNVMCVEGFISAQELITIHNQLENIKLVGALVGDTNFTDEQEYKKLKLESNKIRKSNISFLYGEEWNWLYEKLSNAVNHVNINNYCKILYGISPLQYSEYDSKYSGFYGQHADLIHNINCGLNRSLSFSLQITDGDTYEGGDVNIYYDTITYSASRKAGTITFFDASTVHEVLPVSSGFRKSIVGWVLGPRL